MSKLPLVSIIIPTYNEGRNLKKTIDSIEKMTTYPYYEIIVVDDGSTDGSIKKIKDKHVKIVKTKRLGAPRARNAGAKKAKGDILVFCDSHVFPKHKKWIDEIVGFHEKNKHVGVVAPVISVLGKERAKGFGLRFKNSTLETQWNNRLSKKPFETPLFCACCFSIKKDVFFKVGMFNQDFFYWWYDDYDLALRCWLAGFPIYVLPHIECSHIFKTKWKHCPDLTKTDENLLLMALLYFNEDRVERVLRALHKTRDIIGPLDNVVKNGVFDKRDRFNKIRKFDDEWYFRKFKMKI